MDQAATSGSLFLAPGVDERSDAKMLEACAVKSWELGGLDFFMPANIVYGWGRVGEISDLVRSFGHRALVVTMPDLPHGERVQDLLRAGGMDVALYAGCEPEPSIEGIDAAWADLSAGAYDVIVGVGGGSAMDTAKAFAVLQAGGGSAWDYTIEAGQDQRPVPADLLPIIAVPTTAGTGSEVTYNAVLTNRTLSKKAPIRSPQICPRVALIDPELSVTMPPMLTASTGFDAFTHAYERYFGTQELSPYIHQLALNGMAMVVDNLETAVREPGNHQARMALSWAATQAGMVVVAKGGEAALHVFGLPIGAVSHVPHGQALAIMTGPITQYHALAKPERARELAGLFGIDAGGMRPEDLSQALADALVEWIHRIGLPTTLSGHGIGPERINDFMAAISETRIRNVFGPGFCPGDIQGMYRQSL